MLAGVSVPYYTRLERGDMSGASTGVLEALARALQLDEAERAHLFDLARAVQPTAPRRADRRPSSASVRRCSGSSTPSPAPPRSWATTASTSWAPTRSAARCSRKCSWGGRAGPPNFARFVFLEPRARDFYRDWERAATDSVAILRSAAGRDPHDRDLSGSRRRALHPERGLPHSLGRAQRPLPRHRRQAPSPPRGRGPEPQLRAPGPRGRRRPHDLHVHRRARLEVRGGAQPPGQLGGDDRSRARGAGDSRSALRRRKPRLSAAYRPMAADIRRRVSSARWLACRSPAWSAASSRAESARRAW